MTSEFAIAVHALVFLEHKGIVISSEELAKNVCTNPARIRKVMAKLKRADLIRTKEGTEGGYLFLRLSQRKKGILSGSRRSDTCHGSGGTSDFFCVDFVAERVSREKVLCGIGDGRCDGGDLWGFKCML